MSFGGGVVEGLSSGGCLLLHSAGTLGFESVGMGVRNQYSKGKPFLFDLNFFRANGQEAITKNPAHILFSSPNVVLGQRQATRTATGRVRSAGVGAVSAPREGGGGWH